MLLALDDIPLLSLSELSIRSLIDNNFYSNDVSSFYALESV
jgi:hypothetical protein